MPKKIATSQPMPFPAYLKLRAAPLVARVEAQLDAALERVGLMRKSKAA